MMHDFHQVVFGNVVRARDVAYGRKAALVLVRAQINQHAQGVIGKTCKSHSG
ncbi:MAG: hypothetical protein Dbin4_01922, partial [Alphaproteobacteria bacterium]|nr:hypothetical protein [Alphaproteobacteria bacterium]